MVVFFIAMIGFAIVASSQILHFPLRRSLGCFELTIYLGDSQKRMTFPLNFRSNHSMFTNFIYHSTTKIISHNLSPLNRLDDNETVPIEIIDDLHLINLEANMTSTIRNYPFYYYYRNNSDLLYLLPAGRIGVGFFFLNKSYSLIHQIKHMGHIQSLSFSVIRHRKNRQYYLYLGGLPSEVIENLQRSSCSVRKDKETWSCSLASVTLNDYPCSYRYETENNGDDYVVFSTETPYVYSSTAFLDFCIQTRIVRHLKMRHCYISEVDNPRYVSCDEEAVLKMGVIMFEIGEHSYTFEVSDFWSCYEGYCGLNINENPQRKNEWVFGSMMFEKLNMTFDYDNKQIHFYSRKEGVIGRIPKKEVVVNGKKGIVVFLYIVLIIIAFIGILINLFIKRDIKLFNLKNYQ